MQIILNRNRFFCFGTVFICGDGAGWGGGRGRCAPSEQKKEKENKEVYKKTLSLSLLSHLEKRRRRERNEKMELLCPKKKGAGSANACSSTDACTDSPRVIEPQRARHWHARGYHEGGCLQVPLTIVAPSRTGGKNKKEIMRNALWSEQNWLSFCLICKSVTLPFPHSLLGAVSMNDETLSAHKVVYV